MVFSLSGTIITQTGTDTDLSALSGVAGVTHIAAGSGVSPYDVYDIGANRLIVAGALKVDGNKEKFITTAPRSNNGALAPLYVTGTLDVGTVVVEAGITRYSEGDPINCVSDTGGHYAMAVAAAGTLNVNGGRLRLNGMFNFFNGATANVYKGTFYQLRDATGQQFRMSVTSVANSNKLNFYDCTLDGETQAWNIFTTNGIGTAGFTLKRGVFLNYVNAQPDVTFDAFNNAENVNPIDYEARTNTAGNVPIINFDDVSRRLKYGQAAGIYNGYCRTRRNMNFTFQDVNQNLISKVSHYSVDTDSGNRGVAPAGYDDTADKVYSGQNVTTPFLETFILETFRVFETNNVLITDDRTDADSTIVKRVLTYNHAIGTMRPVMFGENAVGETTTTLLPDFSITEPSEAVARAYPTQETPYRVYDHLKALLVRDYEGETQTTVTREGQTLDFGTRDVTILDGTGEAIVTDASVTIHTAEFVGNIITSGLVTLGVAANILGTITDKTGTRSRVNLTLTEIPNGLEVRIRAGTSTLVHESSVQNNSFTYEYTLQTARNVRISIGGVADTGVSYERTTFDFTLTTQDQTLPVALSLNPSYQ